MRQILLPVGLMALLNVPALAQQEAELRYKFEVGRPVTYRVSRDADLDGSFRFPGLDQRQKVSLKNVIEFSVRPFRDDKNSGRVSVRVDRIAVDAEAAGDRVRVDTEDKAPPATPAGFAAAVVSKLLGREFEVEVTRRGEIKRAEGIANALADAGKEVGLPAEKSREFLNTFDETSVAGVLLNGLWPKLPEERIRVGDSWKQPVAAPWGKQPADGKPLAEIEYTLRSVEIIDGKRLARIAVQVKADPEVLKNLKLDLPMPQVQGLDLVLGLKTWESDGEIVLDLTEGRLLRSKLDTRLEFNVSADLGGQPVGLELKYDGRELTEAVGK
jgi:hypothetical protein